MRPFYVYILHCADGAYYVGHTDDMALRMQQHDSSEVGYSALRKPVKLLWQGEFETREGALAFELQIKGWSRAKKEALMAGDWERVQELARSHVKAEGAPRLRQAQPERVGECAGAEHVLVAKTRATPSVRPEPIEGNTPTPLTTSPSVRPEPIEGNTPTPLTTSPTVRPEPIEGNTPAPLTTPPTVQPEPVEGNTPAPLTTLPTVQPEPVEGNTPAPLTTSPTVQPEPVEGRAKPTHGLQQGITGNPGPQQRRAMSKAITLLESTRVDHRAQADDLLTQLLPHTGKALRLGISGVPGVGKSTFIETLGLHLISKGHRVAVLAIDPSSTVSGGSILGDKTRMEHLSMREEAYIRPSPSSGTLGGVAEKTREAMLVCEAAGYDIVIVETVGVGQSETTVWGMTDMFVLLQLPNAGDELQAIKKGVMEIADLVVINKADIDQNAATRAQAQITSSLRLLGLHGSAGNERHDASFWQPKVLQISALVRTGIDDFWAAVTEFNALQTANGRRSQRRQQQNLAWMWQRIDAGLKQAFRQNPGVQALLPHMLAEVAGGRIAASTAARNLLEVHTQ